MGEFNGLGFRRPTATKTQAGSSGDDQSGRLPVEEMTSSHQDSVQWNNEIISRFEAFFSKKFV